ncbi:DNA methyltransferase [Candidatus Wolfebacteria bacterium CG_4_10_14_0_2_um_filter_39_18]|uniref:site-specific DNA-methyltransferase (adenine-specific) n=1 Tax=Candidatus Wolfebacteria bacterium CG_4_10_14_0_2_um_filter_39_18 TaxID=1975061 RepID=A0A2M7TFD8_9BACT|nr:MAG: DNA methyltransferase [Candidatus Wolfebacteria bacterium CG_4_10_14_0_2_um_filter_39_18]
MVQEYLEKIFKKYETDDATERTYYPVLEGLLNDFASKNLRDTSIIIEPRRTKVGVPDFKIKTKKELLIGYIEAKDLGRDLDKLTPTEQKQIEKYLKEYPKLIVTNFIEFRLYENGEKINTVLIAHPLTVKAKSLSLQNEPKFISLLDRFFATIIPQVYSSKKLAELLARKTQVLKNLLTEELNLEDKEKTSTEQLYDVFRHTLLHDLTPDKFADMYAQTITYGLFVARLSSGDKLFNRTNAFEFIPKTIPLLRRLFHVISGQDLPQHIAWHVEEIAEILSKTKIEKIKEDFFAKGKERDPIIHFYETFLKEYDPKERERMGVYYTPEPVVSYIVRSINALLKEKFDKKDGFADQLVTVLDPAAGTLTFPAKAISVAKDEFSNKYGEAGWVSLVKDHILKNFYAFEILMAPYAVGHLKIGLLLDELGYKLSEDDRFKLFLTNTLEIHEIEQIQLVLAKEISEESKSAYRVKKEIPILVIVGNPPYSGESENPSEIIVNISKGEKYEIKPGQLKIATRDIRIRQKTFIGSLIEDYKYVNGEPLGERNPKWLQDDYVKFFRFAQWKLEQNSYGVLGFITNHAWLDNPTFRGMRVSLLNTFDEIYILDLHGSTLKKEKTPEGGKDENVFDIQPGVAITIGIKNGNNGSKKVSHTERWGLRKEKYDWLERNDVNSTPWGELQPKAPDYRFRPLITEGYEQYERFWKITDVFPINSVGIVTARDDLTIQDSEDKIWTTVLKFSSYNPEIARSAYNLGKDALEWKVSLSQQDLKESGLDKKFITPILYRPFDIRYTYYTGKSRGFHCRPRLEVMKHMLKPNLALFTSRIVRGDKYQHCFVSQSISDAALLASNTASSSYIFPLYLYNNIKQQTIFSGQEKLDVSGIQHTLRSRREKEPNINKNILNSLKNAFDKEPSPEEFFYYIYAVLYSNIYRKKYNEFLKIDFPRIPFAKDYKLFQKLSYFGKQLVDLHLLQSKDLDNPTSKFYGENHGRVERPRYDEKEKKIYVNKSQYFDNVVAEVWNYYIGGYQVLNKWLKDRKNKSLSSEDIKHYCKIVTALSKTIEIQKEIDKLYPGVEKRLIRL